MNSWKRKVQSLIRLAEDQAGKPEGELAREKLQKILARHPEAWDYEPVRRFTSKDLSEMVKMRVPLTGHWEGANIDEAINAMLAEYSQRLKETKSRIIPARLAAK
jgi:hypothetical protein